MWFYADDVPRHAEPRGASAEVFFCALPSRFACAPAQVDSKKELEDALKGQCEAFIMTITKLMIDAVLSFLAKATAARAAAGGSGSGAAQPLREHAFAGPERVGDLLRGVRKTMLEVRGHPTRIGQSNTITLFLLT